MPDERGYIGDSFVPDGMDAVYEANGMENPTLSEKSLIELDKRTDPRVKTTNCFNLTTTQYRINELIDIRDDYNL